MCMFAGPARAVHRVDSTNIFARPLPDDRQALIYSMNLAARATVAMILPLPVPPGVADDAVEFIDLSAYPRLFHDLDAAFPKVMVGEAKSRGLSLHQSAGPTLKVHPVGSFEASFVPSLVDFSRLDPRFRLDPSIWDALPAYADFGFAVFQLRGEMSWFQRLFGRPPTKTIHPMAFTFPTRDPDIVFFPTRHVHDGQLHATARFDHHLYVQLEVDSQLTRWVQNSVPLKRVVDGTRAGGLIDVGRPCWTEWVAGDRDNEDIVVQIPETRI